MQLRCARAQSGRLSPKRHEVRGGAAKAESACSPDGIQWREGYRPVRGECPPNGDAPGAIVTHRGREGRSPSTCESTTRGYPNEEGNRKVDPARTLAVRPHVFCRFSRRAVGCRARADDG